MPDNYYVPRPRDPELHSGLHYKSKIYQLNSLRLGLIHEDNIHGKHIIFLAMGSQSPDVGPHIDYYKDMHERNEHNIIIIPFDNNGTEPGDDHEIVAYYENVLGIKFYVTEKITKDHVFFKDFGAPTDDFTEYRFDSNTKFMGKS